MADSMRIRPPDPSDRVAGLASSIIHAYHGEHDADAALALLADPFSWIGADEGRWRHRRRKFFERVAQRRPSPRRATISSTSATMPSSLRPAHISSPEATGLASLPQQRDRVHRSTRIHGVPARRRKLPMPPDPSLRPFDAGAHECRQPRAGTKYRRARYAHRGGVESFRARRNSSGASTKLVLDITEHVEIERALVKISYEGRPHAPFQPLPIPQGPRERALRRRAAPGYRLF